NTILEEDHVGLSCYGSYAYVRAYGHQPLLGDALHPVSPARDGSCLASHARCTVRRVTSCAQNTSPFSTLLYHRTRVPMTARSRQESGLGARSTAVSSAWARC